MRASPKSLRGYPINREQLLFLATKECVPMETQGLSDRKNDCEHCILYSLWFIFLQRGGGEGSTATGEPDCQDCQERTVYRTVYERSQRITGNRFFGLEISAEGIVQSHGAAAEAIIYVALPGLPPTQTTTVAFGPINTTISLSSTRAAREVSYGRA